MKHTTPPHFDVREACPACRDPAKMTLYRRSYRAADLRDYLRRVFEPQGRVEWEYLEGAELVVVRCDRCGLVYQEQVPDESLLHRLYEVWIDPDKSHARLRDKRRVEEIEWAARVLADMHRHLEARPFTLKVLDFGAGWGSWCHLARGYGCEVYAMELSPSRARHLQTFGVPLMSWNDLPGHAFDMIHSEQVFEHVTEPLDLLTGLVEHLRPGGLFRLCVPDGRDVERRLRKGDWTAPKGSADSLDPIAPLEHLNCFDGPSLRAMVHRAGLEVVPHPPPMSGASLPRRVERRLRHLYHSLRGGSSTRLVLRKPQRTGE